MSAKEERNTKPLWDRLIDHEKIKRKIKDQKFLLKKIKDYEKEAEGCTFEPQLETEDYEFDHSLEYITSGDIYDRNNVWRHK